MNPNPWRAYVPHGCESPMTARSSFTYGCYHVCQCVVGLYSFRSWLMIRNSVMLVFLLMDLVRHQRKVVNFLGSTYSIPPILAREKIIVKPMVSLVSLV